MPHSSQDQVLDFCLNEPGYMFCSLCGIHYLQWPLSSSLILTTVLVTLMHRILILNK